MNYPDSPDLFEGKFTDGDPVAGIPASVASAEHMNAVYDELAALIAAGGIAPDAADLAQVAKSVGNQLRSKRLFDVSGTANAIVLTTPAGRQPVTALSDYDEFSFIVSATNTGVVTIKIDDLAAISLSGVVNPTEIIRTALLTVRYIGGVFYIAEQINPVTCNPVSLIGKIIYDPFEQYSYGEVGYNGGEVARSAYVILFEKAKAGLISQGTKNSDTSYYGGYFGDGDGATTFTLPWLDGAVIRGLDNGRGFDAGRTFGSWQDDAMKNITAAIDGIGAGSGNVFLGDNVSASGAFDLSGGGSKLKTATEGTSVEYGASGLSFDASRVVRTANEFRVKSYAFPFKTLV